MITKKRLIDDVVLQLSQGAPSDDFSISDEQIAQWATLHLNDLVTKEVWGLMQRGYIIPAIYFVRESKAIQVEAAPIAEGDSLVVTGNQPLVQISGEEDAVVNRFYINLTGNILNLPRDRGLIQILLDGYGLVYKTSPENLMMLNDLRFARPTAANRTYNRFGSTIYLDGFGENLANKLLLVDYIPFQDVLNMEDDDVLKLTEALEPVLLDMIVQRGKLELYGTQPDTSNDGVDYKQVQYHTAISNPTKSKAQPEQTEE